MVKVISMDSVFSEINGSLSVLSFGPAVASAAEGAARSSQCEQGWETRIIRMERGQTTSK